MKNDDRLMGWDVVYKVSPHGKVPIPNNEDYNIYPNTYDGEFFQEDGLEGHFEIDLTRVIEMEVHDCWHSLSIDFISCLTLIMA